MELLDRGIAGGWGEARTVATLVGRTQRAAKRAKMNTLNEKNLILCDQQIIKLLSQLKGNSINCLNLIRFRGSHSCYTGCPKNLAMPLLLDILIWQTICWTVGFEGVDWMHLAQDNVQCLATTCMIVTFNISKRWGISWPVDCHLLQKKTALWSLQLPLAS